MNFLYLEGFQLKIINSNLPVEEVVVKLIKKANSRGGNDNISIAYLKKESGDK